MPAGARIDASNNRLITTIRILLFLLMFLPRRNDHVYRYILTLHNSKVNRKVVFPSPVYRSVFLASLPPDGHRYCKKKSLRWTTVGIHRHQFPAQAARLSYGDFILHRLDRSFASPSFDGFAFFSSISNNLNLVYINFLFIVLTIL